MQKPINKSNNWKNKKKNKNKTCQTNGRDLSLGVKPFRSGKDAVGRRQKASRMKVYYEHLNQVRIEMITNLQATQAQIVKQKKPF
ncbi:Uncharacterised protein [Rodentibacter pneumotropicus]|uniref:Uncharacterized protein n=1 Tax=Rodentibacter pneumotropicus TaxID=758 RepID=A0A448MU27_9PAST|nr:Uncharacterised protein [Rodentibacter pneumotropicus]